LTLEDLRAWAPLLLQATFITVYLSIISMSLAMVLALGVAVMRLSSVRGLRWAAAAYIDFMRGTPLLLQLFYIYYVLPFIGIRFDPIVAGIIGLSLNNTAYLSEVYRASILAVPTGQREAATVLGMSEAKIYRRIILPQAFRIALPPIGNYGIAMFKDTSLVGVITVHELLFTTQILAAASYQYLALFTITFVIYFAISYPASLLVQHLEGRLKHRGGRRIAGAPPVAVE
jgi:His/Glu/Gln/Arg/opine family amino acid ABC transporter permease subunit